MQSSEGVKEHLRCFGTLHSVMKLARNVKLSDCCLSVSETTGVQIDMRCVGFLSEEATLILVISHTFSSLEQGVNLAGIIKDNFRKWSR